jgi:hypothetical protein
MIGGGFSAASHRDQRLSASLSSWAGQATDQKENGVRGKAASGLSAGAPARKLALSYCPRTRANIASTACVALSAALG